MLNDMIYNYFSKSDRERTVKTFNPKDILYFNPSSFSACKRGLYYKKRNVPSSNPVTAITYLKMDFGSVLHTRIQSIVKKLGILIEAEKLKTVKFSGLNFRYKTDGIIVLNKQRTIMEIKTVSSGGLRVVRDKPKNEDTLQMVLYMIFSQISHGVLLYIGRDSAFMEEYVVTKGDHLYLAAIAEIERKMSELRALEIQIKQGIMPKRDGYIEMKNSGGKICEDFQKDKVHHKSFWQCNYCQWKDSCWAEEQEEIKSHKFYIDGEFID